MTFAIVAELPLGTYHGGVDGGLDEIPSPARLHAALLCAAAQGTRALPDGDGMGPCPDDEAALRWLEDNPPDGLTLPATHLNTSDAVAYRDLGLLLKHIPRKQGKRTESVAVDGAYAWTWSTAPDATISDALAALCADVASLGRAESPVRLRVGDVEPTHERDSEAEAFTATGVEVSAPTAGRLDELYAEHTATRAPLRGGADKVGSSEDELRRPVVTEALRTERYNRPTPDPVEAPWDRAVLVPLSRERTPGRWDNDRVRWAVALHRSLISLIGDGAPAIVTGAYEPGVSRPANRVAIQTVVDGSMINGWPSGRAGFVMLLPRGATDDDLRALALALRSLRVVTGPGGRSVSIEHRAVRTVRADEFWCPVPEGHVRVWQTDPAMVADTRPPRGGQWSLADSTALSVAMVWRDKFKVRGRGEVWYRGLADAAASHGVEVLGATRITDGDLGRFVHKVNEHAVVQPYRATLTLGDLAGDQTVVAIGQSRHLGGGLLVPRDVPNAEVAP